MFIIHIEVKSHVSKDQHEALFPAHAAWFKKYFDEGEFVLIGPYLDRQAGVIIANTANREALIQILEQDSYYPDLADYDIREFVPKMIAKDLDQLQHA